MSAATTPVTLAVVLSGGRGSRLGGRDKARVVIDGHTLLDRVLASLPPLASVIVAGDVVDGAGPTHRGLIAFVREQPPHGGPVAGLYAGLDALPASPDDALVAVVAVDMPWLSSDTFVRLAAAAAGHDGAVLVDADGRRQLCALVRRGVLVRLRPERTDGAAVHRIWKQADLAEVATDGREATDIDTPADLG